MIRTQISFDPELYRRAKEAARREGISLSELCRRGVAVLLARQPSSKPWMALAGKLEGDPKDSSTIDSVVYRRESP